VAGFVIKRVLWALVLMIIISAVAYVLFFLAANPVRERAVGTGATSVTAQFEVVGKPIPEQYARFVWAIVRHGELGHSFVDDRPVTEILGDAVPVTAALVIGGSILFMMIALPIGILSALRPRSLLDRLSMVFVLIGVSAHPVWIALMLSYFVGAKWHLTPIAGYCDFFNPSPICGGAVDWASHMMLPWITFACLFAALYARMVRASVLETLGEDYVRTAVAKGAGTMRVLRVHVLRNALLPVITMIGMDIGVAFGGVVFIETVFGLPGVGNRLFRALPARDLPVMMGVVLVVSVAVVVMNLIIDLLYPLLNPRVGLTGTGDVPFRLRRSRRWTDEPPDVSGSARPPRPARTGSAAVPQPAGPAPSRRQTGSP
jgi:peptide/nickel transport system permease protein